MNDDEDDDLKPPTMPLGDIGIIAIALVFFIAFLWLMFGPSPFAGLTEKPNQTQSQSTAPAAPEEVTVTLPKKPKQEN